MRIGLLGYGKMGKAIEPIAIERGHEIGLKITSQNSKDLTASSIAQLDVAIEFSRPETAFDNIKCCLEQKVPVVVGTTAWLDRLDEAKALCEKTGGALLWASNFSIGVNLFFAVNRILAKYMADQPQYAVALEEIHHTQKLDAPSGTAITLAEAILAELPNKKSWKNTATTDESTIPIVSKREGQVPGTHEIVYQSPIDTITIRHEAHSRKGFAMGAVLAAEWLVGKAGFFDMNDFLGFK
ncbi:MAG: 4-hydroxy-tetrahydrodipicolinate reductase [Bacteroidota bacterium]